MIIIARLLSSEPWSRYPNQPSPHGREEPTQLSNQRLAGSSLSPGTPTPPALPASGRARCRRYFGTLPHRFGTNPGPVAVNSKGHVISNCVSADTWAPRRRMHRLWQTMGMEESVFSGAGGTAIPAASLTLPRVSLLIRVPHAVCEAAHPS